MYSLRDKHLITLRCPGKKMFDIFSMQQGTIESVLRINDFIALYIYDGLVAIKNKRIIYFYKRKTYLLKYM
jgi:hypothetical protein